MKIKFLMLVKISFLDMIHFILILIQYMKKDTSNFFMEINLFIQIAFILVD